MTINIPIDSNSNSNMSISSKKNSDKRPNTTSYIQVHGSLLLYTSGVLVYLNSATMHKYDKHNITFKVQRHDEYKKLIFHLNQGHLEIDDNLLIVRSSSAFLNTN